MKDTTNLSSDGPQRPERPSLDVGPEALAAHLREVRAWERRQAETSREGAIKYAASGDPDDLLLRRLTEDELELVREHAARLSHELKDRGEDAAAAYVATKLYWPASERLTDLVDMAWDARADIEANGHLAMVTYDSVPGDLDGTPWSWCCHCNCTTGYFATREEALAEGAEHIAEHGGRWADEMMEQER